NSQPYQAESENEPAMMRPVSTKKGRSPNGYSGAVTPAISHVPPATSIPKIRLLNRARPGYSVTGRGRPRNRTAKVAAIVMQQPDQASAPKASDGRCQPAKRTPVANVAVMQPAATANHGRHREEETKSRLK